jgi:hypothetical protein
LEKGRVGKTCISKALTDDNYHLDERIRPEEGINIQYHGSLRMKGGL